MFHGFKGNKTIMNKKIWNLTRKMENTKSGNSDQKSLITEIIN
jgi:hypothetical protein